MNRRHPVIDIHGLEGPPVRFPLRERRLTLGQSPFNSLTLPEEGLPRRQAEILLDDEGWRLIDRSGQGTFLNGTPVQEARLKPDDEIRVGSFRLCFREVEEDGPRITITCRTLPLGEPAEVPRGVLRWTQEGRTRSLTVEASLMIGADENCHIPLDDPYVSRRHAQVLPTPDGVLLRDLQSTNGTWIGPVRVMEAYLSDPCSFRVGRTEFDYSGVAAPSAVEGPSEFFDMAGRHPALLAAQRIIARAAPLSDTVLVLGETGTGKELAARALHALSGRDVHPFVPVNCGAISADLIESELFGHEKGAFTGATSRRAGAFESAGEGTVFLDEVGELPLSLQPKLLRALELREIKPVGSDQVRRHRARVIAATNRDLARRVQERRFREDLYYRLSVLYVSLPPLRERREDIPILAERFLREAGVSVKLAPSALDALRHYYWPGNVRELKNALTMSLCVHPEVLKTGLLEEEHLLLQGPGGRLGSPALAAAPAASEKTYRGRTLEEAEGEIIREAMGHFGGNKRLVSQALGISKSALYEKLKRFGSPG